MRCPNCGNRILLFARRCSVCTRDLSPYVHLPGVLGGVLGSLLGFTFFNFAGALGGGLLGIILYVVGADIYHRCRGK